MCQITNSLAQIWHKNFCRLIRASTLGNKNGAAWRRRPRLVLNSYVRNVHEGQSEPRPPTAGRAISDADLVRGIPDMRYINREVRIIELARALDLRLDGKTKIHCWHADRHQHGDRTASVGIRTSNNTVKCFGCDSRPMGPIDMVMDVVHMTHPADAALWIADRFNVPFVPRRRPNRLANAPYRVGYEQGLGLLVRSGLWATLSESTRCIAPVLLEMAEKVSYGSDESTLQMSYVAISRFSGVRSPRAVRKALVELTGIGFLQQPCAGLQRLPERSPSRYIVTPLSDELREAANVFGAQLRMEITVEKELRARARQQRIRRMRGTA